LKLLILSSSSIIDINRAYIRHLKKLHDFEIHLAILYKKNIADVHNGISNFKNEPFDVSTHEIFGIHPRLEIIRNLDKLIERTKPNYILMEYDTASYITFCVLKIAKKYNINVGTIIVENRYRDYLIESYKFLIRLNIVSSIGSLLCFAFQIYAKKNINNLFPISKESCNVYKNYGFKNIIIHQIPYGIDLSKFKKQDESFINYTRSRLGLNCFTIAYFGRLVPEKGVDILLKSLSKIKNQNYTLLLDNFSIYKNDYINTLKEIIIQYDLVDKIIFFDSSHNDMPDYYNAADLVVLPSIETKNFKEQYGRVLVESMACETLIIGSNTGAIPEILNEPFLLFKSNDVNSLVCKIDQMMGLNNHMRDSLISDSLNRTKSKFGVEHQALIIKDVITG